MKDEPIKGISLVELGIAARLQPLIQFCFEFVRAGTLFEFLIGIKLGVMRPQTLLLIEGGLEVIEREDDQRLAVDLIGYILSVHNVVERLLADPVVSEKFREIVVILG